MARRSAEHVALVILLGVVGLRPLVGESFHSAGLGITAVLEGAADPWVLATLVIDAVVLVIAAGVCLGRCLWPKPAYRRSALEWGAALLAVAAVASCALAGEKRPAINAALDLIAAVALGMTLVQLLDRGWKTRLALCVVVASSAANAAECIHQRAVSFAETEQMYLDQREEIWTGQGIPLDSPQVQLFEQRLRSREAAGYFAHSNVAGGYLLLGALAALSLAFTGGAPSGSRRSGSVLACVLVAGVLLGAVVLTKSVGAVLAGVAALLLVGVRMLRASWMVRRRAALFFAGWAVVILGVGGVVVCGVLRGGLPHTSLDFRWRYWTASAGMFGEHWLTGVGPENFGDHYLEYKTIDSPEEVKNPHNFLVQFATEYGTLGLFGALVMLVGGSWAVTRPAPEPNNRARIAIEQSRDRGGAKDRNHVRHPSAHGHSHRSDSSDLSGSGSLIAQLLSAAAVAAAIFISRAYLLPSRDPALIAWETMFALSVWGSVFVLLYLSLLGLDLHRGAGRWTSVVNCGLFAFLLQDTVNFALFVPGSRTTFFALVAVSIAARASCRSTGVRPVRSLPANWITAAICTLAAGYLLVTMSAPMRAERTIRRARAAQDLPEASPLAHPAHLLFDEATRLDRLDASAPAEHARWLQAVVRTAPDREAAHHNCQLGLAAIRVAIARAPQRYSLWMRSAQLHVLSGVALRDRSDFEAAVGDVRRAVALYPTRPESHEKLGDCLLAVGTCETAAQAVQAFRKALELDDARPAWERFRRLSVRAREQIETRIAAAEEWRSDHCGASAPLP